MALSKHLIDYIRGAGEHGTDSAPKRGDAIFDGTDYPPTWDGFIGQEKAKEQLRVQVGSARARGVRLEHTLLATGLHGVGKSHLATLYVAQAGAGLVRATGPMTPEEFRRLAQACEDRDAVFIDEIHLLVAGNRNKADWILPFMTEGTLNGYRLPDITIVGATTDVGKLPQTLISRFMVQPELVPYTPEEAAQIARNLAGRMGVEHLGEEDYVAIGQAADANPRMIRQILTQVRDLGFAYPDDHPNLEKAFEWAGVSMDGLSKVAREILLALLPATDHTLSLDDIKGSLGEPGPIQHHEQQLRRFGLIETTARGRRLTDQGLARARREAEHIRAAL